MKKKINSAAEKPWNKSDKKTKEKKKMKKPLKILLIILLSVFLLIIIAAGAVGIYAWRMMNRAPDQNVGVNDVSPNKNSGEEIKTEDLFDTEKGSDGSEVKRKDGVYNFLIIGRDKVALNTDVMIAVSFDINSSKAATVQIPRDSYVEDDEGNKSKINAVFARGYTEAQSELQRLKRSASGKSDEEIAELCKDSSIEITADTLKKYINGQKTLADLSTEYGIKKLQRVISRTFGIYFDYYAIVSTDAFVKIVDAVGGVDIYVQQDMNYDDPLQDLHIHIKSGLQHLNGKEAEGFVRFRSGYVQADIARLDAQKIFLTAFFEKLLSFSSVTKVDDIVRAVYDSVDTDMSLENALGFVKPALAVDLSNITMLNMQGSPYNNGMYYSLNKEENLKIVNEHFNIFTHDLTPAAISVVELVTEHSQGDSEGMTMEDISENQPSLGFIPGRYNSSVPVSSGSSGSSVSSDSSEESVPVSSGSDPKEENSSSDSSQLSEENNEQGEGEVERERENESANLSAPDTGDSGTDIPVMAQSEETDSGSDTAEESSLSPESDAAAA